MKRALFLFGLSALLAGCDFEGALALCADGGGRCARTEADAGPDASVQDDAGLDAGSDAGSDAGLDAGSDAGADGGADAGPRFAEVDPCLGLPAGNHFCWESPLPQGNALHDVLATDGGFFIAGAGGALLFLSTQGEFSRLDVPLVDGAPANDRALSWTRFVRFADDDVWLLGDSATVVHYNGTTWAPTRLPCSVPHGQMDSRYLAGVRHVNNTPTFVVSNASQCTQTAPLGAPLSAADSVPVVLESGGSCFAVVAAATNLLIRCDGTTLTPLPGPATTLWPWLDGVAVGGRDELTVWQPGGVTTPVASMGEYFAAGEFDAGAFFVGAQMGLWGGLADGGARLFEARMGVFATARSGATRLAVGGGGGVWTSVDGGPWSTPLGVAAPSSNNLHGAAVTSDDVLAVGASGIIVTRSLGWHQLAFPEVLAYDSPSHLACSEGPAPLCVFGGRRADGGTVVAVGNTTDSADWVVTSFSAPVTGAAGGADLWIVGANAPARVEGDRGLGVEDAGCAITTIAAAGQAVVAGGPGCIAERSGSGWTTRAATQLPSTVSWLTPSGTVWFGGGSKLARHHLGTADLDAFSLPLSVTITSLWASDLEVWVLGNDADGDSHVFVSVDGGAFSPVAVGVGRENYYGSLVSLRHRLHVVRGSATEVWLFGDHDTMLRRPRLVP